MIVFPNAKINLGLNVLSRRSDGFHDIATVMYPIDWRDVLEITIAPSGCLTDKLEVSGYFIDCPPEKNLVLKAVKALRNTLREITIPPLCIYLHKNIPDGAGLGGGSSDAAFTLEALNRMFKLQLSNQQLADIAATIGSDCPFFVYNQPMIAEGRGEILTPMHTSLLPTEQYKVIVVKPSEISVPTAKAYAGISPTRPTEMPQEIVKSFSPQEWSGKLTNDFEKTIFNLEPRVGEIKQELYSLGAIYASMSGSGSAVYGIFATDTVLDSDELDRRFKDCRLHY